MKRGFIILALLVLFSSMVSSAALHNTSDFYLDINGAGVSLKQALDNNMFKSWTNVYSDPIVDENPGHPISLIWISYADKESTLLDALNSEDDVIGGKSTYSPEISGVYHLASDIIVESGVTLQDAIIAGALSFPCVDETGDYCQYDTCKDGVINCYGECEYAAPTPYGAECGSESCSEASSWWSCNANGDLYMPMTCYQDLCSGTGSCVNVHTRDYTQIKDCAYGCVTPRCIGCSSFCDSSPPPADDDDGGGGKVICTEMVRLGYMSKESYAIDLEYASKYLSEDALKGYRIWGVEVVKGMRNNPEAMEIIYPMFDAFMEEVEYRMGERESGNEMGALYLDEAVPLFERIGILIDDPHWEDLFSDDNLFAKYFKFIRRTINGGENPNNKIIRDYFSEEKLKQMFYDSLGNKTEPDMEFSENFVEEMKKSVEEIENMVS